MAAALIFLTAISRLHAQEKALWQILNLVVLMRNLTFPMMTLLILVYCRKNLYWQTKNQVVIAKLKSSQYWVGNIEKTKHLIVRKIEVLGLNSVSLDPKSLESKLLSSVSEVRLLKDNASKALNGITSLSESLQVLLKTTKDINPQVRLNLEIELRNTLNILSSSDIKDKIHLTSLNEARIIDIQGNTELIVANVGASNGVKLGMTFSILRNNKKIASAYVIDVREKFQVLWFKISLQRVCRWKMEISFKWM